MKKSLITLNICLIAAFAFAQEPKKEPVKQDTLFVLTMKDFRDLAIELDSKIDSKDATKRIIAFIEQKVRIIPQQPADKPKKQ